MENILKIKKCFRCGAIIKEIQTAHEANYEISCCGEKMKSVIANSTDGAIEKHVPVIKVLDDSIQVEVKHVMEEEHYIEWIAFLSPSEEHFVYLKPNDIAVVTYQYIPNTKVYAYCNKHGLWEAHVD
jgi:superoxide reductase